MSRQVDAVADRMTACAGRYRAAPMLALLFAAALLLRIGMALYLERSATLRKRQFLFADTELYWKLGQAVAQGGPYTDGRRWVLRTPGYPLFLGACQRLFGPTPTAARHAQAAIGAASCLLLVLLAGRLFDRRTAWVAGWLAAVHPFAVFLSVVLLSEALFTFVLLLQLLALATVDQTVENRRPAGLLVSAALAGLAGAGAALVRPSWALATPLAALALAAVGTGAKRWAGTAGRARPLRLAAVMLLAFTGAMLPWWLRNYRVTGHLVLTTLWVGASLYDGLNDQATGASNMVFMDRPQRYGLDPRLPNMGEWEQDRYLRRQAWQFVRSQPGRALQLAAVKLARFWNPVPNERRWREGLVGWVSLVTCAAVYALVLGGLWLCRHRPAAALVLIGPLLYFCLIHLVFVSSIRYREAAMLPALALAACAVVRLGSLLASSGPT